MAALLGAAHAAPAHTATAASAITHPVINPDRHGSPERLGTENAARSNAVLTSEKNPALSQMSAPPHRDTDRIAPNPPKLSTSPDTQGNSGWRYTAALLGTLAILATIAVRRFKAGTPWA